ncbi:hypothetical protein BJY01DRAFT_253916 [Aspergillus pseudoustus]|uniref:Tc toxin complex TcA C-terminal TcB-binding domain-containing protein n=1 Tax=Aspergillus pseudoustus TaxID=1810923 RepID=A0ABR4IX29_9EURO
MAVDMIKTVRRAMDFELGLRQPSQASNTASIASSWETCRDGLLSGEVLAIEVQRLKTVYETTRLWDYEIYRSVSLREIDPRAFLELRETGHASFELKESLFDRDFPGHYCRRLMETKVYFPGASRSIGCTLTLTEHKYRISATKTAYEGQSSDDFRTDKIPIQSIAATKSSGGNGKLEPTFYYANEYFPFEGAGVVSKWNIEFADELRQFDYSAITDVEFDMNYGAIAGGDRQAALDAAAKDLETGPNIASIDLIKDLKPAEEGGEKKRTSTPANGEIVISQLPTRLPYITSRGSTMVKGVELFLKSKTDDISLIKASIDPGDGQGLELTEQDVMGDFFVRSNGDGSVRITDEWKITLQLNDQPWSGELKEAWLLISYTVTGIV